MKIGIDLRSLNYAKYTGINANCIHILGCLSKLQSTPNTKIEFIGIGLKKTRLIELRKEFSLFNTLFSSHRTLEEYNNLNLKNTKLLEIILTGQIYFNNSLDSYSIEFFNYIIQPQPRLLRLHKDTKLISFFHDVYGLNEGKLRLNKILINKRSWKLIANRCDQIVTNSRSTSVDLVNVLGVEVRKLKLIYPGIPNLNLFRDEKHSEIIIDQKINQLETPYILAISGIEPRKNWHNLLLAFKELQSKNDYNKKLVLVGTVVDQRYYNYLLRLIKNHNINNIEWCIEPIDSVKYEFIKNCEFMVYPSFYEGFGFPILEAQQYAKNILTSKNSSLLEVNSNYISVNPNNYQSIASGILALGKSEFVKSTTEYCWDELELYFHNMLIKCS